MFLSTYVRSILINTLENKETHHTINYYSTDQVILAKDEKVYIKFKLDKLDL